MENNGRYSFDGFKLSEELIQSHAERTQKESELQKDIERVAGILVEEIEVFLRTGDHSEAFEYAGCAEALKDVTIALLHMKSYINAPSYYPYTSGWGGCSDEFMGNGGVGV